MAESSYSAVAEEDGDGGSHEYLSIPRGGPIYIPDMVGSPTRVPLFESLVLRELQELRQEIGEDSIEVAEEDGLCVDELKIITEEELVDKAFEVAFKDGIVSNISSGVSEKPSDARIVDDRGISRPEDNTCVQSVEGGTDAAPPKESNDKSPSRNDGNGESSNVNKKKKKKRGRQVNQNSDTLEESYITKVKQLVKIKEKQDEEKAAAKLHSFNGSCRNNESTRISSDKTERITSLRTNNCAKKVRMSSAHEEVQVLHPEKEIVLCVEVYHNRRTTVKTQEFLVLGRQPLSELRDKIYCLTDQIMRKAGQHDPSGYFLIEDVFCNDLRESSAIDYSKPILDWLKDSKKEALAKWEQILSGKLQPKQKALIDNKTKAKLPQFKAFQMHKTRLSDLSFRLGAGYLYCHQGDCKHVIVIRDMRLLHPEDVLNRLAYPVLTFQTKSRIRKCSACQIFRAEKVTVDDKWAGENPCYFCDLCYYMLHYVDSSLLYNEFSVHDYYPD